MTECESGIEHEHEHEEVEVEEEEERTSNAEASDHQHVFVIPSSFVIRASAFHRQSAEREWEYEKIVRDPSTSLRMTRM